MKTIISNSKVTLGRRLTSHVNNLIFLLFSALTLATSTTSTSAANLTLHVGPPSLGGGGPNPVSIPPGIQDIEVVYVNDNHREYTIGLIPGLLYGIRTSADHGVYASAGGGLLLNPGVASMGVYTAFGYNTECKTFCFNFEYKQSMGIFAGRIFSPYAVRLGMAYYF